MKNKLTYIIPGILFLLLLIPVTISVKADCDVYMNGNLVTVKILKLPSTFFTKHEFMFFQLDGNTYSKSISQKQRDALQVGEDIQLRYLQSEDAHFLFPEENPTRLAFFEIGFFLVMSIISFYYAFKK